MDMTAESECSPGWMAEAFEAMDAAAILFDSDGRCVAANARYLRTFRSGVAGAPSGASIEAVVQGLALGGGVARAESFVERIVGAIRGFRGDFDVPMADGRELEGSCNPTARGGYLVTFRDTGRVRLRERSAVELVSSVFESAGMGTLLWDASLRVQVVNRAWVQRFGEVAEGMSLRAHAIRLVDGVAVARPRGQSVEAYADDLIARMHAEPVRFEGSLSDGRTVQIATFPTQTGGVLATATDLTEERNAERRVRDQLEQIVESLAEGVGLYDAELRLQMSNDALHRHAHGDHPRMPYGTHMAEHCAYVCELGAVSLLDGMTPADFAESVVSATRSYSRGLQLPMADGRTLEMSSYPTPIGGYLFTLRDITERKRADEANALIRTVVESLGEGVALYDSDLRLQMNNPAFRRLVMDDRDLTREGTHLADEVRACIAAGLFPVPEDGPEAVVEWILGCVDGSLSNVELPLTDGGVLEASNFRTPDGGYLVAMRDITERKRAEEATREADALVRTIVEASPTTFLVSRLSDARIVYAPPVSRETFSETDTMHAFFIGSSTRQDFIEALLPTGMLQDFPVEFRRRSDGAPRKGLISARLVDFGGEKLVVSSTRDITEQTAMQEELERQREIAHQNEKLSAMGELLAGVSHELSNPLSVVVGYAMMLDGRIEDPLVAARVHEISVAAERCAKIVKTFLAMARQRPAELAPASINELIEVAADVAAYGLRASGAALRLELAPDLPEVTVDNDQMAQVFANLIANAEHALAGRADATLTIATRHDEPTGRVVAEFRDTGAGIVPKILPRVFEPYFTTKDAGAGTGFGLAYCHRVVTAHGGEILLDSRPGEGTTIAVALPANSGRGMSPDVHRPEPVAAGSVLLIDDDPNVLRMLSEVLQNAGWSVTALGDGRAAVAACRVRTFDAVLCDLRMPGMDGFEVAAELSARLRHQVGRLAFLTGDGLSPQTAERLARFGRPVIEKPATPEAILALVAGLKEGRA